MPEAFPDRFTGLSVTVQAHGYQVADAGEGAEIYLSATASPGDHSCSERVTSWPRYFARVRAESPPQVYQPVFFGSPVSWQIALPNDPMPLLLTLRAHFIANPTHELATENITAAEANALALAVKPSIGAESYRVLRQVQTLDVSPVELGLFNEPMTIISGMPSGKTVVVSVSARNEAGETLPATASLLVA
jgi:hypothetical protein